MKKKVGIIFAMQKEADAVFGSNEASYEGKTKNGTEYVGIVSGIGKVNAAIAAYRLCKEMNCSHIISLGCAGGINYDVNIGDVVVGDEYMYYDVNCGRPNALGQVQGLPETYASSWKEWVFLEGYKHGLIATGDTFVQTMSMANSITFVLYPKHCPLAIDMESAAIAQVCHICGADFVSARVISDNMFVSEKKYESFWEEKDGTLRKLFEDFKEKE